MVGIVWQADVSSGTARAMFKFTYPDALPKPGVPFESKRTPALKGIAVPVRMHLGVAGVASETDQRVNSIAPGRFGGNIDQWRFGIGTAMLYPVLVPGALFSCGDGHLSQGDGEVSGWGIETHLNATLQFRVLKSHPLNNPVLSTPSDWVVHGFGPTLDEACRNAAVEALDFLVDRGLDSDDAYGLLTVAADFGITQVVDNQLGVHVVLRKSLFASLPPE